MAKLKLSAPWTTLFRQYQAFFQKDKEVHVAFDERKPAIKVFVDNGEKADALNHVLPESKTFGNVTVSIQVIPANGEKCSCDEWACDGDAILAALKGNKAFVGFENVKGDFSFNGIFIMFAKEVVQYFNDNLGDYHGAVSTLYQDLADEIFESRDGVFFNTDLGKDAGSLKPALGWNKD